MIKSFLLATVSLALVGCEAVDPLIGGSSYGTVVSVSLERGCSVTFTLGRNTQEYVSKPATPYKEIRCRHLKPGQTVPVATDPVIGDYPYVLFGSIDG